jgi:hypothetical protein
MSILLEILRSFLGTLVRQWPELVSTFYGVLLGGLAALAVVKWQLGEERKTREGHDKEFLTFLVEHVNREITKNTRTLDDLIEACQQSVEARIEIWDWATTIVGAFTTEAHNDLYRTGLQRYLPVSFEEQIRRGNTIAIDIGNQIRQARAQHIFNDRYRDDGQVLNDTLFAGVKATLPSARAALIESDNVVSPANLPWTQRELTQKQLRRRATWRRRLGRLRPHRKKKG